jgi:hypothetical protein
MAITQTPASIVPALWSYTYLQAPMNGQGYPYFDIPASFSDEGSVATGTLALDLSLSNVFKVVVSGNMTFAFDNITDTASTAQFWQVEIKSGGSHIITWPASIIWDGGGASNISPVLSLDTTILNFFTRDNGTTVFGAYAYADLKI